MTPNCRYVPTIRAYSADAIDVNRSNPGPVTILGRSPHARDPELPPVSYRCHRSRSAPASRPQRESQRRTVSWSPVGR